jgi:hypothetical protein
MSAEAIERCKVGRFKPGHKPKNTIDAVGVIRNWTDGNKRTIAVICIGQGKWQPLYQYNWEKINGPKPKGTVFWCKDGNPHNTNAENWEIITRQEQVTRNSVQRYPKELQATFKLLSKLQKKIKANEKQT